MTTPAPLRIGMIGAGMISSYHLVAWQRCPGAEVVAIADPSDAAAGGRVGEFGIPAVIGCGEVIFKQVLRARSIEIDAANRHFVLH